MDRAHPRNIPKNEQADLGLCFLHTYHDRAQTMKSQKVTFAYLSLGVSR